MERLGTIFLLLMASIFFLQPVHSYPKDPSCNDKVNQDTSFDGDSVYNGDAHQSWSASFKSTKTNGKGSCGQSVDDIHISDDDGNSASSNSGNSYTVEASDYGWLQGGDDVTVYFDGTGSSTSSSVTRTMPRFSVTSPDNPSPNNGASDENVDITLRADIYDHSGHDSDVTFYHDGNGAIATDSNVCSGCRASVSWNNLNPGTTYSWYARADDGQTTARSNTFSFDTVHRPNQANNPSPSNGESSVPLSTTLSTDVSHPDGIDMDVEFYVDDGSGMSFVDTDTNVPDGGTASISTTLDDPGTTHQWKVISRARTLSRESSTWSFTTNSRPNVQTISKSDSSTGHAFSTVSATIDDPDGDDDISSYQLVVDDGESNTQTYSGSIDRSYGNGNEARLTFNSIGANDNSGWSGTEDMQLEVQLTDSQGTTTTSSILRPFPNHAPTIESGFTYLDDPTNHAFTLSIDAGDVDGDSSEITSCTVSHNDGSNYYTNSGTVIQGEPTSTCQLRIEKSAFSGYQEGETINHQVTFSDRHGGTVTSSTGTHMIPNTPPTASNLRPTGTAVSYGPTINATYNDADGDAGSLTFYNADTGVQIGNVTGLLPGEVGQVQWNSANNPGTTYNFTVEAEDSVNTTSTFQNFTTIYRPQVPYDPFPENNTVIDTTTRSDSEVAASVRVQHPDDRKMAVRFINASDNTLIDTRYDIESGTLAELPNIQTSLRDETNTTYEWYAQSVDRGTSPPQTRTSKVFRFDTVEVGDVNFQIINGRNENFDILDSADNGKTRIEIRVTSTLFDEIPRVSLNRTSDKSEVKTWNDLSNNSVITVDLVQDGTQEWDLETDKEYEWFIEAYDGPNEIHTSLNYSIYTYNTTVEWDRSQQFYNVYQYDVYRAKAPTSGNLNFDLGDNSYTKVGSTRDTEFKDSGPELAKGEEFCWKVTASNPTGSSDGKPIGDGVCKILN